VVVVALHPMAEAPSYPRHFLPGVAAVSGFDLGPGESRIVSVRVQAAHWSSRAGRDPGAGVQLVASLHARNLHPMAGSDSGAQPLVAHRTVLFGQMKLQGAIRNVWSGARTP
jgi:hypothetical protein